MTGREGAGAAAERLGAARDRGLPEREARGLRLARGRERAAALAQALAVFEPAQLLDRAQRDVAVGADAPAASGFEIRQQRKEPVAEIALGAGAETHHRAGGGETPGLAGLHAPRMHQAPGRIPR